jgi:hypothetical protein
LAALAKSLLNNNLFDELLYWSKIWLETDERDVTAMAYYYVALQHQPGKKVEALHKIQELRIRFPDHRLLAKLLRNGN